MLLAGDVGGTKTLLGLYREAPERPAPLHVREFATLAFPGLGQIVGAFLKAVSVPHRDIAAAGFGGAGPVTDQVARRTNVPWPVDAVELSEQLDVARTVLLNDLEAMA